MLSVLLAIRTISLLGLWNLHDEYTSVEELQSFYKGFEGWASLVEEGISQLF